MGQNRHSRREREHGFYWGVLTALYDGDKSGEELRHYYSALGRKFGFFMELHMAREERNREFGENLRDSLNKLLAEDLISETEGRYTLTAKGREKAAIPYREVQRGRKIFSRLIAPTTVSTVTLAVHFVLAALKLPAGILSGSVGLLNDAVDTLLDGISSLLVFFGFKFNKERLSNVILVVFMLATGGYTLFRAVQRFFIPYSPEVDVFTFVAALASAAVCGLLWLYQRFAGLRNRSFTLITQSVDSRNHVIVAVGVTAGLIAARMDWPLLDTLVGLAVAVLILKSALELLVELVRAGDNEEVDLSRYKFTFVERMRKQQLCSWLLYLVERGEAGSAEELVAKTLEASDFESEETRVLEEFGLRGPDRDFVVVCIDSLVKAGRLEVTDGTIGITPAGRKYLHPAVLILHSK